MREFFITGTDTDAGKTVATVLLLQALDAKGKRVLGVKPISAGCELTPHGLRNDDALQLQRASNVSVDYELVNPIAFEEPIAPHIAAQKHQRSICLDALDKHMQDIRDVSADIALVEGAGGWRLPLNNQGEYLSDFAKRQNMPVILVVGMKLGCLNHALLTYEAIVDDGLQCVGWIANHLQPNMPFLQENIETLESLLNCPKLAEIPFQKIPTNIQLTTAFSEIFA